MIGDIPNLLKDLQGAKSHRPDATARLVRSAVRLLAPEYAPIIDGAERLATHLGVRVTPEGIDVSRLKDVLSGASAEGIASMADGTSEPWTPFLNRLRKLSSGVVLIMGPRGAGKTQLAVRLAEQWRGQHGYAVLGINMYRQDRRPWITFKPISVFADGIEILVEALDEGQDPPPEICRRIVVIDESSLSLHPQGERGGILAVERAIRQARHVEWLVIIVCHLTKDLPTQMDWCDAVFVKEPTGKEMRADRDESRHYWEESSIAYRELRHHGLRGKPIEGWVYVDAEGLGYKGMMPYGMAEAEDPHQSGRVRRMEHDEAEEQQPGLTLDPRRLETINSSCEEIVRQ